MQPMSGETRSLIASKNMAIESPILVRIFKEESELEVWKKDHSGRFALLKTYPICRWSGDLGPKVREGDRQAPEGFYSVSTPHLHRHGRWPRALDVGYPNLFDRANGRTGSAILVHGGCSSIGCFAMTNPVMEEIFQLSEAALESGQDTIPIHIYPFRMTEQKLAEQSRQPWYDFWRNLKEAYDLFEETRRAPHVSVCGRKYLVRDPDHDMGAPTTPRRMVKLVRMMRGEFPLRPGECGTESTPTYEAIAAASRIAHKLRAAEVPAIPEASMPVPQVPVPVPAVAPASRVAAKPRMLVSGVRNSCEIAARNSLLAWLAACACASLACSSSFLRSRRCTPMTSAAAATTTATESSSVISTIVLRVVRQPAIASSKPDDTITNSGYWATRR